MASVYIIQSSVSLGSSRACPRRWCRLVEELHTAAYVSIRQHTSAYVSIKPVRSQRCCRLVKKLHTSEYVSKRQNTPAQHQSAYVSIRPNTSEHVSDAGAPW